MAVVKFLSNKDCHVFIDMELAGKVTPESMLKVTLETGGYLIQIKDEDANLIKEYELEIKSSDNQLLQKIDGVNNNLDDTIRNLKNDSSLVFHCDRASFCHNGLYGFVDKKFNIVIPPIYYSVNEFADDKAFVVRDFPEGRKTTLIDSDGNMFFNRWYDYIGEGDSNILMGIDNRIIVYSKIKFDKIAEYYNAGYNFKQPFIPVYILENRDEMYSFINSNGDILLPFIFDKVWNVDDNLQSKFWYYGFIGLIDFKHSLIFDVYGRKINFTEPIFGENEIYLQGNTANIESSICVYPGRKDGKWILGIGKYGSSACSDGYIDNFAELLELKEIECDRIIYIGYNCYAYRLNDKCVVHYLFDEKEYIFNENYIVPIIGADEGIYYAPADYRFLKRKDGKYGILNEKGEEILPCKYDLPNQGLVDLDPIVLQFRGKYSLANLNDGKFYLPFEYDQIIRKKQYNSELLFFILRKGNKYILYNPDNNYLTGDYDSLIVCGRNNIVKRNDYYGIVDDNGVEIMPIRFDLIAPIGHYGKGVIIRNGDSFVLGDANTGNTYPAFVFDEISLLYNGCGICLYLVRKGDKYGCINNEGDIFLPIEYDGIETIPNCWADNFIIKIGDFYALGDILSKKVYTENLFDEISLLGRGLFRGKNIYLVKKGNKCGCINNNGEIILPIKYDRIETNTDHRWPWDVILYNEDSIIRYSFEEKREYFPHTIDLL